MVDYYKLDKDEMKKLISSLETKYDFKCDYYRISKKGNLVIGDNDFVFDEFLNLTTARGYGGKKTRSFNLAEEGRLIINKHLEFCENCIKTIFDEMAEIHLKGPQLCIIDGTHNREFAFKLKGFASVEEDEFNDYFTGRINDAIKTRISSDNEERYKKFKDDVNQNVINKINEIFEEKFKNGKTQVKYFIDERGSYSFKFCNKTFTKIANFVPSVNITPQYRYDKNGFIEIISCKEDIYDFARLYAEELLKSFEMLTFSCKINIKTSLNNIFPINIRKRYFCNVLLYGLKTRLKEIDAINCEIIGNNFKTVFNNKFVEYNIENKNLKIVDKDILYFLENEKDLLEIENFVEEKLRNKEYMINAYDGKGIIFKYTKCSLISKKSIFGDNIFFDYRFEMPSFEENKEVWKKEFSNKLKITDNLFKEQKIKIKEKYDNKIARFKNNFIYYDMLKFIELNEKYITFNAMQEVLRGKKTNFGGTIIKTDNCGKYDYYSKEELEIFLKDLIKEGFIKEREYKGTYGTFYTLKLSIDDDFDDLFKKDTKFKITDINKKLKDNENLNDTEALFSFEKLKEKDDLKSYIKSLNCLTLGFICLYGEEYKIYTKNAPNEFKRLIELKKKTETDKAKIKFYNELIKNFKEK